MNKIQYFTLIITDFIIFYLAFNPFTNNVIAIDSLNNNYTRNSDCPCNDQNYCKRIIADQYKIDQTIGYVLESDEKLWSTFEWKKLTIISLIDFHQPRLMCLAHENNVQIMAFANFTLNDVSNSTTMMKWIDDRLKEAIDNFYDGINLFIDDPVESDSIESQSITKFIQLVVKNFHQKLPGSIVLFNAPFSAKNQNGKGVDGKNYDYTSISKSVDLMVAMEFDQRSQFDFDDRQHCIAGPSESLYITIGSLMEYKDLGINLNQMIIALGFFVDEYLCIEYHQNYRCIIKSYEYRGSNCSSKIANRIPWNVYKKMNSNCWRQVWDEHSDHDIYTFLDNSIYGQVKQYWSDNLRIDKRLLLVNENQMSGIGIWMLNYIDDDIWLHLPIRHFM